MEMSLFDIILNYSGVTVSGSTLSGVSNVYTFLDEKGNVTQIKKELKHRNKYYIDPEVLFYSASVDCYIGVSDSENGNCTFGIALGVGDVVGCPAIY
jgi:hypothetical protein